MPKEAQEKKKIELTIPTHRDFLAELTSKGEMLDGMMSSVIRDLAYDTEDMIDKFNHQSRTQSNVVGFLTKRANLTKIGKQIEELLLKMREINTTQCQDSAHWLEKRSIKNVIVKQPDIFGPAADIDKLVSLLGIPKGDRLRILSISGKRGLGKSTVAKKIFCRRELQDHIRVWVRVDPEYEYSAKDLLINILTQVKEIDIESEHSRLEGELEIKLNHVQIRREMVQKEWDRVEKLNVERLREELHVLLEGKRYLVVIDGMLKGELWDAILAGFPNHKECFIIEATRQPNGSSLKDRITVTHHNLYHLNEGETWDLLCNKLFSPDGCDQGRWTDDCSDEVRGNIFTTCDGLPLAIIMLGGYLIGKNKCGEFHIKKGRQRNQDQCESVFDLTYSDLSYYLKSCFLYLCLFPNGHEINVEKLILLWVAEGFVRPRQGDPCMEDVAKDCLHELLQRDLIQVAQFKYSGGPLFSFQVQDSLRDLHSNKKKYARRQIMHSNSHVAADIHTQKLRSLLYLDERFSIKRWDPQFGNRIKMLRVLDLEGVHLESGLAQDVGKLSFLRYLGLRNTRAKELPASICNLVLLQTLDARGLGAIDGRKKKFKNKMRNIIRSQTIDKLPDMSLRIPDNLLKMKKLRHLYLETYGWSGLDSDMSIVAGDLPRNLLTLHISGPIWKRLGGGVISQHYGRIGCLRSLTLRGQLICDNSSCFPISLIELNLEGCELNEDPSGILGGLPELQELRIRFAAYKGNVMRFSAGKFPKLQFLQIHQLPLVNWIVDGGAIPSIRHLEINRCQNLMEIPDGLRNLGLQKIEILSVSATLHDRVKPGGDDWAKISYIPLITLTTSF